MTTETKEAVPVLDILRDGGVIEISQIGDKGYSAGLRPSTRTGHWYADVAGVSPIGALTALMGTEGRQTAVLLTEREQDLCLAALVLSQRLWQGKRDVLWRDMLRSWLDAPTPDTDLLPREVLDHLLTDVALLYAYAALGFAIYGLDGGLERRNPKVRDVARAFLSRVVVDVAGYGEAALEAQLVAAEGMLWAQEEKGRLPQEITLPLDGVL